MQHRPLCILLEQSVTDIYIFNFQQVSHMCVVLKYIFRHYSKSTQRNEMLTQYVNVTLFV